MATVLVTGGSGFIGREVVKQLDTIGYKVRVLSRRPSLGKKFLAKYKVEEVSGNVEDRASLAEALRGIDVVVHLVGIIFEKGGQTFEGVHVKGTENIVRAAEQAGIRRFIHMSAIGGKNAEGLHLSEYHRTKALAEGIVRNSTLEWTIFRPSVVFGAGDGFVNQLASMVRFPMTAFQLWSFPLIGGGKSLLQPIAVSNVAEAFARSIAHADAIRQTYDLVGKDRLTLCEVMKAIGTAAGHEEIHVEKTPVQLFFRAILWTLTLVIPPLLLILALLPSVLPLLFPNSTFSIAVGGFSPGSDPLEISLPLPSGLFIGAALLWFVSAVGAFSSRKLVLFELPWFPSLLAGAVLGLLPKPPLTMGQVLMLQGDNVGDASPATKAFHLDLKSFRAGIREYL